MRKRSEREREREIALTLNAILVIADLIIIFCDNERCICIEEI